MDELISRQEAIDALEKIPVREFKKTDGLLDALVSIGQVYMALKQLPSAQPEITHCKDCKHFWVDRYKKLTWCSRINYGYGYQADDFCSKAERRTE